MNITAAVLKDVSRLISRPGPEARLDDELLRLRTEVSELREAELENERLKRLLGFESDIGKTSVPARVIGRDPDDWSSVVFIDRGSGRGIERDMAVVSDFGLVGRVREVGPRIGKVMLINDADSRVGALIQESREQGLLVGTIDGKCKLIYLSLDAEIGEGDTVMTSGMGGVYPGGLVVGHVVTVYKEPGKLYKSAIIQPASALSSLEEVICLKR